MEYVVKPIGDFIEFKILKLKNINLFLIFIMINNFLKVI